MVVTNVCGDLSRSPPRYDAWQSTFADWKKENPENAALLQDGIDKKTPSVEELMAAIPEFDQEKNIATRIAGEMVLQPIAASVPMYVSGSADLHGSNKNYIKGGGDFGVNLGKRYMRV